MINFKEFLREKYEELAGGSHGHYGHIPDNVYYGSKAAGSAAALFGAVQQREGKHSNIVPQKKTDGKVSVVTVRNDKDSPFHNPKYPEHAVGVAYKGRMDSKTIHPSERVSYSHDDVKKHYGEGHHLTPMLSSLLDHAHKIHGNIPIIQHDVHTTNPRKDIEFKGGKATWQPNTIRNHTTDPHEINKLKKSKIVIASHTGFDKSFQKSRGLEDGKDVKSHPDVYNVNLAAPKIGSKEMQEHNKAIHDHISDEKTRRHLDTVSKGSYQNMLERFTNHKVNKGEYGESHHEPLNHHEFKKFVSDAHDKEIAKVKTDKARAEKIATKTKALGDIDRDKDSINTAFKVHHTLTNAVTHYVTKTHEADKNAPIKHELPDGKGGFEPATPEGYVPRGPHEKINYQKFNIRARFNRMNKISGEQKFGKKPVSEAVEREHHAVIVPAARMHPPTMAHDALVNDAVERAKKVGGIAHIFLTHSKPGDEKSPLSAEHRVEMLQRAYKHHIDSGHLQFHVGTGMHANLSKFHQDNPHVKHAHILLGDDRMDAAESLKKYNNVKDKTGKVPYAFKSIDVNARTKTPSKYDHIHATELRNKARSGESPESIHKFFKERMHPNIPDNLIHKTISDIQKVTPKKKVVKEMRSFREYRLM